MSTEEDTALKYGQLLGMALLGVAVMLMLVAQGQVAHAATITVNTTDDELNADGDCSLREAIQAANTDTAVDACPAGSGADTIVVPAGTYTLSIAGTGEDAAATGDLDITDDLTITSAGEGSTIIDGGTPTGIDRVFHIIGATDVTFSGVTIRDGDTTGAGGGIWNADTGDLTVTDSTITNNTAGGGGGIENAVTATLTLTDVTITDNTAGSPGGGIRIDNGGTATLTGVTITNNTAGSHGGGIDIHPTATATLTDVTITNNTAGTIGGGIRNDGTATLTGSTISDNDAGVAGGGIENFFTATLTLTDVTVTDNTAGGPGGGIRADGTLTLTDVTVTDNTAGGHGGGIDNHVTATLTDVTIANNTAGGVGGGIENFGTATLTNVTISGNTAGDDGGGIRNSGPGDVDLRNVTVTLNTATDDGDGLHDAALGGTIEARNTIVANNGSENCAVTLGAINSLGHNLDSGTTCGFTDPGDLSSTSPLLGPLQDNGGPTLTHALLDGSPAIDAGSPDCPPPATDQRGVARPQDAACDIGAFEFVLVVSVGGILVAPDQGELPLEADSSGTNAGVLAGLIAGVTVGTLALGGAAWYARRRLRAYRWRPGRR